jgi:hypothetical protein
MSDAQLEATIRRLVDESGELNAQDEQRLANLATEEAAILQEQLELDQLMRMEAEVATSPNSAFMAGIEELVDGPSEEDDFMHRIELLVEPPKPRRIWLPWTIAAAAALAVVGLIVFNKPNAQPVDTTASTTNGATTGSGALEKPDGQFVDFGSGPAAIVRGYRQELTGPFEGRTLSEGRYALSAGICQLKLQTGTSLVLQAPAEFTISDPSKLELHRGSLRAVVPSNAVGFRVITDHCEVIDLSTEFGVTTQPDGGTFVQTFVGLVEVVEPDGKRTPLPAPEQATFGGDLESSRRDFITIAQLRMLRWKDHHEALLSRDDLLLYYDFQGKDDSRLVDHARQTDAKVTGTHRVQGRWPGKRARQFEDTQDVAQLTLDQEMTSFTIATWINVDRFAQNHAAILNSSGWQAGDLHLQLTDNGALNLGIAPTDEIKSYRNANLWKSWSTDDNVVPLDQWVHLAIRADADKQEVTFFVNGRVVEKLTALGLRAITPGDSAIGKWLKPRGKETRPLRGRMDEFLILGSALTNREVQALYNQNGIEL